MAQVVWDAERAGTATSKTGPAIRVGPEDAWTAAELLAAAAASDFMSTLLQEAAEAGIEILGFVSTTRFEPTRRAGYGPTLCLNPCIVVRSPQEEQRLRALCARALRASPVSRSLEAHLTLDIDIRALP